MYEGVIKGRWPVLCLAVSSSRRHCTAGIPIIAEFASWVRWNRNLDAIFCPVGEFNHPLPYLKFSTQTATLLHTSLYKFNLLFSPSSVLSPPSEFMTRSRLFYIR